MGWTLSATLAVERHSVFQEGLTGAAGVTGCGRSRLSRQVAGCRQGFYNGRCSGGFRPLFPVRLGVHGLKKVLPGILGLSDRQSRRQPAASIQRVHDRVEHSIKYVMLLGKFHLGLGGMDVHVHRRHRQQHLQHTAGEPALEKLIPVAFL